ncbi:dihydrolipoyl dehydrogenase [Bacteroidia bacterium]|nr:dihydrolipoyl dehydrogenase [Bacteroidia bacterium]
MYDIVILGAGPGGYEAALRAAHLGFKVALIEREAVGGTCLNCGCIPTKTLLKSAHVMHSVQHAAEFGIALSAAPSIDFGKVMARSQEVVQTLRKGIHFLLQKQGVTQIAGTGKLVSPTAVQVQATDGSTQLVEAQRIIIATGARPRSIPAFPIDEKTVISSRQALNISELPSTMVVIGSGAIGCEMAYFYAAMGVQVTLVEALPNIAPLCDVEVSRQLDRSLRKAGINTITAAQVQRISPEGAGCSVYVASKKGDLVLPADLVLSAVGIQANIDGIGLEEIGIITERGKIKVDSNYCTNIAGVLAIGDVIETPALAHVATAEGVLCVERIAGLPAPDINYNAIPSCIYTTPEVAWVGLTEEAAAQKGTAIKVAKASYLASGKANSSGARDGFVKLIFAADTLQLLGAHCIGEHVTELLGELTLALTLRTTASQIAQTIHAHPTMYEAIREAAASVA